MLDAAPPVNRGRAGDLPQLTANGPDGHDEALAQPRVQTERGDTFGQPVFIPGQREALVKSITPALDHAKWRPQMESSHSTQAVDGSRSDPTLPPLSRANGDSSQSASTPTGLSFGSQIKFNFALTPLDQLHSEHARLLEASLPWRRKDLKERHTVNAERYIVEQLENPGIHESRASASQVAPSSHDRSITSSRYAHLDFLFGVANPGYEVDTWRHANRNIQRRARNAVRKVG